MLKQRFLKFTHEFSEKSVNLLDMTITLNDDNRIFTTLFQKPTNKHEFVHFKSNYPRRLLKSLPYSCGLRIKRTYSDTEIQVIELEKLMLTFKNRGYQLPILDSTLHKLQEINRNDFTDLNPSQI